MANEKVLNCKVDEYTDKQISKICKRLGISHNEIIKNMVNVMVRYMSDAHNIKPDVEEMMSVFEHGQGFKDCFTVCDLHLENAEVAAACYMMADTTGKGGIIPIWIEKPYFGIWKQTVNLVDIVDKFFCITAPDLYRRLRILGAELDCKTIFETIFTLCAMYGKDTYDSQFREMFQDADRSEYGLKPHEGTPFRRKMRKSIESMEIDFRPFDQEL